MDFKVSYLDAGLTYFSDQDSNPVTSMASTPALVPKARRYKTQLRDFLATNRSKRKMAGGEFPVVDPPPSVVGPSASSIQHIQQAAAAAASYTTPYNCGVYGGTGYATPESNLYVHQQQNFYHHPANFDNRYLDSTSLFQYRALGTYYPEYSSAAAYVGNGFLDVSRGCLYDNQYGKDSACQLDYKNSHNSYANISQGSLDISKGGGGGHKGSNGIESSSPTASSHGAKGEADVKREDYMMHYTNGNDTSATRQTGG